MNSPLLSFIHLLAVYLKCISIMYIERAVDHVAWFAKPLVCFWHNLLASAVLDWTEDVMIRAATKALKRGPHFRFLLYGLTS